MLTPPSENYKKYAMNLVNMSYGHFRQSYWILTSNCDFLNLPNTEPIWTSAFATFGNLPSLVHVNPVNRADLSPPHPRAG